MVSDAEVSRAHFEQLAQLSERLGDRGIAVYSHRYDALSFGSWVVEAGTRHQRVRATYDGREGLLRFEEAAVSSNSTPAEWREQESQVVTAMAAWERAREVIVRSCGS